MTPDDIPDDIPGSPRRVIKRYSNRKLYDTRGSTYVTLLQIAEMIRAGEDVQIIDNATKEDKIDVTLALIISEELRTKPRAVPLSTLKALIRHGGERILSQLRSGPMGKIIPGEEPGPGAVRESGPPENLTPTDEDDVSQNKDNRPGLRATLEHWQATIDERIRATLPNFSAFRSLEQEVRRLNERLDALESRLAKGGEAPGGGDKGGGTPGEPGSHG
jgi:polyhydroxyalkanoate synthesis repressor PhaR